MIEKTVIGALPERESGDEMNVEARAEGMVKGIWEALVREI